MIMYAKGNKSSHLQGSAVFSDALGSQNNDFQQATRETDLVLIRVLHVNGTKAKSDDYSAIETTYGNTHIIPIIPLSNVGVSYRS